MGHAVGGSAPVLMQLQGLAVQNQTAQQAALMRQLQLLAPAHHVLKAAAAAAATAGLKLQCRAHSPKVEYTVAACGKPSFCPPPALRSCSLNLKR
jgi:hypothetical protein